MKAAEIAAGQGLLADARLSFNTIARLRRARGDQEGVARMAIRLGSLDPLDIAARLAAAHARVTLNDTAGAVSDLKDLAAALLEKDRQDDVQRVREAILELDPNDAETTTALVDAGYAIVLRAVDAAVARLDWLRAVAALREFLQRAPQHVLALTRLVEVAVDGGLDETVSQTQSQLAEVYLDTGRLKEARFIAEDVLARHPDDTRNRDRLKRLRALMGEPEVEDIPVAPSPIEIIPPVAAVKPASRPARVAVSPTPAPSHDEAHVIDLGALADYATPKDMRRRSKTVEVDLSVALNDFKAAKVPTPLSGDLDGVFAQLREEAGRRPLLETAEQDLKRGQVLFQCGQLEESLAPLQSAARVPRLRFESASLLGRAFRALGRAAESVEWTERASEAPAPTPEAGHQVLYELADALEKVGETARALAVCLELQADTGDYRDLAARVERLTKVQARG